MAANVPDAIDWAKAAANKYLGERRTEAHVTRNELTALLAAAYAMGRESALTEKQR